MKLIDYIKEDYVVIVDNRLTRKIIELMYPSARVFYPGEDAIPIKNLVIDMFIEDSEEVKELIKYHRACNVVYESFSADFIESGYVTKRIALDQISYDLNREVPKLYIKGEEVGVVSMNRHYVTEGNGDLGTNTLTFVYVTNESSEQKVISINNIIDELFQQ